MIIIKLKRLHVGAIALFPFIIVRRGLPEARMRVLLNHEKIHLRQQVEMLVIPFYLTYILLYLVNLARLRSHKEAYRNIVFEREAFQNESNVSYLSNRPLWNFLNY